MTKTDGYETFRTIKELAQYAGIDKRTIQRWIAEGKVSGPTFVQADGLKLWDEQACRKVLEYRISRTSSARAAQRRITAV